MCNQHIFLVAYSGEYTMIFFNRVTKPAVAVTWAVGTTFFSTYSLKHAYQQAVESRASEDTIHIAGIGTCTRSK